MSEDKSDLELSDIEGEENDIEVILSPPKSQKNSLDGSVSPGGSDYVQSPRSTSRESLPIQEEDKEELSDEEEDAQVYASSQEDEDLEEEEWIIHEDAHFSLDTEEEDAEEEDAEEEDAEEDAATEDEGQTAEKISIPEPRSKVKVKATKSGLDKVEVLRDKRSVNFESSQPEMTARSAGERERSRAPSDSDLQDCLMNIPLVPGRLKLSKETISKRSGGDPVYPDLECSSREEFKYESTTEPRMNKCPSIMSYFQQTKNVHVQLYLFPGKKMISKECPVNATIFQIKSAISRYVGVSAYNLDLRRKRKLVSDDKKLEELGAKPGRKMKFAVDVNRRGPIGFVKELKFPKSMQKEEEMQKRERDEEKEQERVAFVNFVVKDESGKKTKVVREVKIIPPKEPKPMIGGFFDKRSNLTFHHAATAPMDFDYGRQIRDQEHQCTQTNNFIRENGTQTMIEKAVQMERNDYYVSNNGDKVKYGKKYFDSDYCEERRVQAAHVIQRNWRKWLGRKEKKKRLQGLIYRVQWAENIRKGRLQERMKVMEEELARQKNPTSLLDLELLYRAINAWREEEEAYVKNNRWGAERKAALATLGEMEADLLLGLEKTKSKILAASHEKYLHKTFNKMSKPKRWLGATGFISFDTEERAQARKLHDIYKELLKPVDKTKKSLESRLDLLRRLNFIVKVERKSCTSTADMLMDLVEREIRFINAKSSASLIAGLRRRMANTFYSLCNDPSFNPEAQRIEKIPWDMMKLRKDMVQCKGCRRMLYRDEFTIVKGTTLSSRCHACIRLYRTDILRIDLNLYRQALNELRRDEFKAGVVSSVAFLIDAFDVRFLIEQIWHGQSALSGIDNRYLLRLCRWKKEEPWAPWNCVLLTEEEAISHIQLEHPEKAYQPSFFHKVLMKQTTAKVYFEKLAKFGVGLDDRIRDNCGKIMKNHEHTLDLKNKLLRKMKVLALFQSPVRNSQ